MPGRVENRIEALAGAPAPAAPLPCLERNNCNKAGLSGHERKRIFAIRLNVEEFINRYGLEKVGFLTITFPLGVQTWQEAQRRFHSFSVRVLKRLFSDYVCVLEFHRDGRPHYHLLVATEHDIRTGFYFAAYQALQEDSRKPRHDPNKLTWSARRQMSRLLTTNETLKAIWKQIRTSAKGYGVGRCEIIPIRKNTEAIAEYVGGYISKSVGNRRPEHKGARMVRYSQRFKNRPCRSQFSWATPAGWIWRQKVNVWAISRGCYSLDHVRRRFGKSWCYRHRDEIRSIELRNYPTGKHALADGHAGIPADAENVWIESSTSNLALRPIERAALAAGFRIAFKD